MADILDRLAVQGWGKLTPQEKLAIETIARQQIARMTVFGLVVGVIVGLVFGLMV